MDVAPAKRTTNMNDIGNMKASGDEAGVFRTPDVVSMHKTGALDPGAFVQTMRIEISIDQVK